MLEIRDAGLGRDLWFSGAEAKPVVEALVEAISFSVNACRRLVTFAGGPYLAPAQNRYKRLSPLALSGMERPRASPPGNVRPIPGPDAYSVPRSIRPIIDPSNDFWGGAFF